MNWLMANRLGHIAAAKAHSRLGVNVAAYPVNVSKAVNDADLTLIQRPLPRLFGVYIEVNGNRGVLVNSNMQQATRRHTTAHELGHFEFGHRPDPARQCDIEEATTRGAASGTLREAAGSPGLVKAQGQGEMCAEAFAAWFLMPRRAVMAALTDLGIDRVGSAAEVYQLSLLLGTTYRATCRHLANVRFATKADTDGWARRSPGRLKRSLVAEAGVTIDSTLDMDVWDLRTSSGTRVEASIGDLLVLPVDLLSATEQATGLTVTTADDAAVTVECTTATGPARLGNDAQPIVLVVHERPFGLYLPTEDPSLKELELTP